jgi:CubicO group peptidase (beta-lactamase class C family)
MTISVCHLLVTATFFHTLLASAQPLAFPGKSWEARVPAAVGLDGAKLDAFALKVGGDGCIVRHGYLIKAWGDFSKQKDWASAAKPVLSTLLLLAVQEGKLASVDAPVKEAGWPLSAKDSGMTYRHLANMVSGYGCAEPPGAAWGYNDFAIQLYAKSLEKIFHQPLDETFRRRMAALEFEDGAFFGSRGGLGVQASVRDFARLGWLWLNQGRWNGKEVVSTHLFDDCIRPGVPASVPRTKGRDQDYLGVKSYGGGTDQTPYGPGVYGFNFWFNARAEDKGARVWPAAPADTYQANGMWNRDTITVFPSLRLVVAVRGAKPGKFAPGEVGSEYDSNLKLLVDAARPMVFPGKEWEEAAPQSQGVDAAKLNAAVSLLDRTVGTNGVRELVIIRNGRLIWKGNDCDKVHGVWSFTSTALGLLIDDGKCTLDTKVAQFLPGMKEAYPTVTLRHFATMTSGYRAVGDETSGTYIHGPSATPFQPNPQPLFTPPGSQYAYWDSAMNQFGNALTCIAGEPLEELFQRRIADPLGMNRARWDWGDLGKIDGLVVNGGSGNKNRHVQISAREAARFGLLFLNRGRWDGKQLLSERWVEEATRVQVPATTPHAQPESKILGAGVYGLNWWVNGVKPDGQRKFPGAPANTFWGSGHNNNLCFVIPEWNMVIVRLGLDGKAGDQVWSDFLARVAEALMY